MPTGDCVSFDRTGSFAYSVSPAGSTWGRVGEGCGFGRGLGSGLGSCLG
jgi:hypothetical protein